MKTVVYRTSVDPDVDYDAAHFARDIQIYLADPNGWAKTHRFVRGPSGVLIRLCKPSTLKADGCKDDHLSCAILGGDRIWLNSDRWMRGAPKSRLPLEEYRQYMVTHEMGHVLGHDHAKCPRPGAPAPVMMQQTLGIGTCRPNTSAPTS